MGRSGVREVEISFAGQSLTHFGGLFLLHRFVQRLGLRALLADRVRFEQRNNRYAISESLLAWLYPMVLGLPPQTTAGVARTSSIHVRNGPASTPPCQRPGTMSDIASSRTGIASAALTKNRRLMSASSGFVSSSAAGILGSSAIPQIGHAPGPS